tara:strand:- start:551 stop:778 length:228 start_codon:yes stop_codon:yes gene_type:complete
MKHISILILFLSTAGCSANFSGLFTVGGMTSAAISKNNVSMAYSAIDLGVQAKTKKPIREHALTHFTELTEEEDE